MVVSNIDKTVTYTENKTLDEKDIEIVSNKIISIVKETTNATLRS